MNNISATARSAMCDALVDLLDGGTTDASGDIQIYTAGFASLLAELTFSATAFGSASSGVATAAAITDDSAANNTGTAAVCRFRNRDNTVIWEGTVSTSGADINLNTVSITVNDVVSITSMTVTMPAS